MPWVHGVADLGEGVNHGALPVRLECNVNVDSGASGWVAQILPINWDVIPAMLGLNVVPRHDWRHEGGSRHFNEEQECKEPKHEYRR